MWKTNVTGSGFKRWMWMEYCFDMDPSTEPTRSLISTNQTCEMLLFLAQFFWLTRWYHKQRLGPHWLSAVLSFLVQLPTVKWLYGCLQCNQLITISSSNLRIKLRHHWQNLGFVLFLLLSLSFLSFFLSLYRLVAWFKHFDIVQKNMKTICPCPYCSLGNLLTVRQKRNVTSSGLKWLQ